MMTAEILKWILAGFCFGVAILSIVVSQAIHPKTGAAPQSMQETAPEPHPVPPLYLPQTGGPDFKHAA
ncbi:hypothetical protein [Hydrogenoanaerobacterium sp.]|uniref:hypothetical protein n=1 Tax=Hydrogenoanaerobacterium sp. TaxID=2953763 RepID=UPI00289F40E5|nr:hypothetical protein [Hydrogenoanaerobacterium sp.]